MYLMLVLLQNKYKIVKKHVMVLQHAITPYCALKPIVYWRYEKSIKCYELYHRFQRCLLDNHLKDETRVKVSP